MQSLGLQNSFYDTSMFSSKPFVPFRSVYLEPNNYALWWKRNPILKRYTKPMADVMTLFNKENLADKIMV